MSLRRKIFYGFALCVVAIVLILPATGWITRSQLFPLVYHSPDIKLEMNEGHSSDVWFDGGYAKLEDAARRFPSDQEIQIAYALFGDYSDAEQRAERLSRQYPRNPVVLAWLVRDTFNGAKIQVYRRDESFWLFAERRDSEAMRLRPSDPVTVGRLIAFAKRGEQIEPQNGFFPMMQALGYFAVHRDKEAVDAWERASRATTWNDYSAAGKRIYWKLIDAATGKDIFIWRYYDRSEGNYSYLSCVETMQRLTIVIAIQHEQKRDTVTGFRLRQATRRIGQRMMRDAKTIDAALTGRRGVFVSAVRPGGGAASSQVWLNGTMPDAPYQEQQRRYVNYLRTIGEPEEATAFAKAMRQGETIADLVKEYGERTYFGGGKKMSHLDSLWLAGELLLAGAVFALVFGGIFKVVYRFSPRLQKSERLQSSARWGVCLALWIVSVVFVSSVARLYAPDSIVASLWCGGIITSFLLILPPLLLRFSWRQVGHGLLVLLTTMAALVAIFATWFFTAGMMSQTFLQVGVFTGTIYPLVALFAAGVLPLIPPVILGVFAILSFIFRVPVAAGVTRGMQRTAVPLTAALLVLWAPVVLLTAKEERLARQELKRMATVGELQMVAAMLHRNYPE